MSSLSHLPTFVGVLAVFLVVLNNFEVIGRKGNKHFKPNERDSLQICCGGIVHRTSINEQEMCCGNGTYDVTTSVCCFNGSFYQIQLPNDTALESLSFLGCCGEEVYDMRSDLCCHGASISKDNATNPLALSCCGQQSYDTETEVCCQDERVWPKNLTGGQAHVTQCCGLVTYDPRDDLCCGGNIVNNEHGTDGRCCGEEVFNVREEICCGRSRFNRTSSGMICCGGSEPFDWDTQLCCGGNVHNETGPDMECCGNSTYEFDTGKCCDDELYDYANDTTGSFKLGECCGTSLFDPRREQCCGGLVIPLRPSASNHIGCCGIRPYDPSTALCCQDLVVPNTNPNKLCCGINGRVYDVRTEVCCSGVAVQLRNNFTFANSLPHGLAAVAPPVTPNVLCCGSSIFDPLRHGCCNGAIFEL